MISLPLDELYLQWLYRQVDEIDDADDKSITHWNILRLLYQKEFVWIVHNDDNRVEDGRDLRHEFLEELGIKRVDKNWMELGCSFLEMLVVLSRRLAFEAEGESWRWFWHLLNTLDLANYVDDMDIPAEDVDEILDRVIYRTYRSDGYGGLFPLRHPKYDQRKVEIWYQLNAYLMENRI